MTPLTLPLPTDVEYFDADGLSFSGMKSLDVSPYRYWYLHINQNRPAPEETSAMRFGSALHCAVLEPGKFEAHYARKLVKSEFEGLLVNMDDLREWCSSQGVIQKARRKDELIEAVLRKDPTAPVWDVMEMQHEERNAEKTMLDADEWDRVRSAAEALRSEERLRPILEHPSGQAEVPMFAKDPATGVLLKAKLDWVIPGLTLDLKTFSQTRGNSIDRTVNNAILYEKYHWQAYHYTNLRSLNGEPKCRYVMAFVESDPPHEVRLRELRPSQGEPNLYWETARVHVRDLVEQYAHYTKRFGTSPWRYPAEMTVLVDEHIPQIAYSV